MLFFSYTSFLDCIEKCTSNERLERVAGCAYTCEMTHGYENEYFLDEIKCLVNNGCLTRYPRDGICHGNDNDGIANLKSLDQVSNCIKIAEVVCFSGQNSSRMPTTTSSDFWWEKQTTTFEVIYEY